MPVIILVIIGALQLIVVIGFLTTLLWHGPWRMRLVFLLSTIVLALITSPILLSLWSFDWIDPQRSTRASAQVANYRVSYVEYPGSDFYLSTLEVSDAQGKKATIHAGVDNYKCWRGWTVVQGDLVEFHCALEGRRAKLSTAWLEDKMKQCQRSHCDLSEAWYAYLRLHPG